MRRTLVLAIFLVSTAAYGDTLYKWVDENGVVHYGNKVPQAHKQDATQVNTNSVNVADSQLQKDKAWLDHNPRAAAQPAPATPPAPASGVAQTNQDTPTPHMTDEKRRCEEEWRKYRESMDCVAPYMTPRGLKPEAAEHCTIMTSPGKLCDF